MPARLARTPLLAGGAALAALGLTIGAALPSSALPSSALPSGTPRSAGAQSSALTRAAHVLLLSVDGLHQSDLTWYVRSHPHSALAALVGRGTSYSKARTTFPSDSFPGMIAQVTGGTPKTTGVYYDVSYNHALLAPGTVDCASAVPGTAVTFDESLDRDPSSIDAGQGLPGLPGSILAMTPTPQTLIDPAKLPVDPATCRPVYPSDYLRTNTIFEVARQHGLRTAWSDKHSAYSILDGPSGTGIQDLFTPEINSTADVAGDDWTKVNSLTRQYDSYKVRAVVNEIHGYDHSGVRRVGTPAVFGMNFQSVSTAQKLPTSDGLTGGYNADGRTPGPLLRGALGYINARVADLTSALRTAGLAGSTTIILSAKHGQSPQEPSALKRIDDGAVLDGLNAAWRQGGHAADLVAFASDDDVMLVWLNDRRPAATSFARRFLLAYRGDGTATDGTAKATDYAGGPVAYVRAGLKAVYAGPAAASFMGAHVGDARVPDLIGLTQHGVVYTGGTKKISEHGGNDPQDRNVPLVVSGPGIAARTSAAPVQTTQIAPTILRLLGLNPNELKAVRVEGTRVLPGL